MASCKQRITRRCSGSPKKPAPTELFVSVMNKRQYDPARWANEHIKHLALVSTEIESGADK